jgi:hypothetical protein
MQPSCEDINAVIGIDVQIHADGINCKKACMGRQSMWKGLLQLLHEVFSVADIGWQYCLDYLL